MSAGKTRLAVVLFNLGGPDALESVKPFLFNLFNDPAIIGAPAPVRWALAKLIAWRRTPVAQDIYRKMGGKSPLLEMTRAQGDALEACLAGSAEARAFIAMRYWHPMSDEAAAAVKAYDPDVVVLLPLYPQFSTTTTASSLKDWHRAAAAAGLAKPTYAVCCAPEEEGLVRAHAKLVRAGLAEAAKAGTPRLLFSAHGLPEKVVRAGDPYVWQVERTARAVVSALEMPDLDWLVCYQSRVGPVKWVGPDVVAELKRAAADKVPVVVDPIAFVSEHSETLVELDIEYGHLAKDLGIPSYIRVPAVGTDDDYIAGLADLVGAAQRRGSALCSGAGRRLCPAEFGTCPLQGAA